MPGPPPKKATVRRRRNASTGRRRLSAAVPRNPPALRLRKVLAETREWWKTIWASPMASEWIDADVLVLRRLAVLVDLAYRGEASSTVLSEIRQLEDRFGMSPMARRRLEWELAGDAPADTAADGAPGADDPYADERVLRLVR